MSKPAKPAQSKGERKWLTIPVTAQLKGALRKAARGRGLATASWARSILIDHIKYDVETDPDIDLLIGGREKDTDSDD